MYTVNYMYQGIQIFAFSLFRKIVPCCWSLFCVLLNRKQCENNNCAILLLEPKSVRTDWENRLRYDNIKALEGGARSRFHAARSWKYTKSWGEKIVRSQINDIQDRPWFCEVRKYSITSKFLPKGERKNNLRIKQFFKVRIYATRTTPFLVDRFWRR